MTLGRCPLSIFCSRGTPPNPESIIPSSLGSETPGGLLATERACQFRANWGHISQSGPDSGSGFQVKVSNTL